MNQTKVWFLFPKTDFRKLTYHLGSVWSWLWEWRAACRPVRWRTWWWAQSFPARASVETESCITGTGKSGNWLMLLISLDFLTTILDTWLYGNKRHNEIKHHPSLLEGIKNAVALRYPYFRLKVVGAFMGKDNIFWKKIMLHPANVKITGQLISPKWRKHASRNTFS